jgi:predicted dehydrogenase
MRKKQAGILMVGVGGYADTYFPVIQKMQSQGIAQLRAFFDPMAERARCWRELQQLGIPRLTTLDHIADCGLDIDLAVVCSPIAYHAEQTCALLEAGINVLCEKPMAATVSEARRMLEARDRSGCFLEIGYQWSFSPAIGQLKADIMAGRLGAPRRLLTRVAWPRTDKYYNRNDWAGQVTDARGHVVNDSPLANATAHFLHNMLYVLGPQKNTAGTPTVLTGECYRANRIGNFDATCCRIETQEGCDILFYTAHCVEKVDGPAFRFIFDDAVVEFEALTGNIVARLSDGQEKNYGDPNLKRHCHLSQCVFGILAEEGHQATCGPESAMGHTLCVEGIQSVPVSVYPSDALEQKEMVAGERLTYVPGLNEVMREAFARQKLFGELGLPWAGSSRRVTLNPQPTQSCV